MQDAENNILSIIIMHGYNQRRTSVPSGRSANGWPKLTGSAGKAGKIPDLRTAKNRCLQDKIIIMWESLARLVLKFRLLLLLFLLAATAFMAYHASRVKLSYDFNTSIPTDNPKYMANLNFRQQFGDDGNLLVVGVQTDKLFKKDIFNGYIDMGDRLKKCDADYVKETLADGRCRHSALDPGAGQPVPVARHEPVQPIT